MTPDNRAEKPTRLGYYGNAFFNRFVVEKSRLREHIEIALQSHRDALKFTTQEHPDRSTHLRNLGATLIESAEICSALENAQEGLQLLWRAAAMTHAPIRQRVDAAISLAHSKLACADASDQRYNAFKLALALLPTLIWGRS